MKKLKLSPGPWTWGEKDGELRLYDAKGKVIATGNYRKGIVVQGTDNAEAIASAWEVQILRDEIEELLGVVDNDL